MKNETQIIDKLVKSIVELVDPLQIILFGSHVRGDAQPDSDIDLLVVMPDGTHKRNTMDSLYGNIRGIDADYDLIVATPEVIEKHRDNIGLIYYYILKKYKILYEREKDGIRVSKGLASSRLQ